MARIDGDKIRQLRESKGLTQLYLATVVEVTTDTISRWENRRYPTIKRENALKLAEALEVEIEAILESETEEEQENQTIAEEVTEPSQQTTETSSATQPTSLKRWLLPIFLLVVAISVFWLLSADRGTRSILAHRELPSHTPPGQPFPVVITVSAGDRGAFPLILKETLPEDCQVLDSEPPITNIDPKTNEIKWIGRTTEGATTFAYMAVTMNTIEPGDTLSFAGTVTLKQKGRDQTAIRGANAMTADLFHWADTNRDNSIDDDEILTVYDRYSIIEGLDFDRDLIDDIWANQGYAWDAINSKYSIVP